MIECLAKNSRVLSGLERCRNGRTNCHFSTVLAFASDVSELSIVNLVDYGALRKVLVMNNTLSIIKIVSMTLTFDRIWQAVLGLEDV